VESCSCVRVGGSEQAELHEGGTGRKFMLLTSNLFTLERIVYIKAALLILRCSMSVSKTLDGQDKMIHHETPGRLAALLRFSLKIYFNYQLMSEL